MTTSKRLRQLADRTGLDGFADELRAMADEMDAAAPVQGPVAIYQSQGSDGMWMDMHKVCHDEYVKLGGGPVRVVYTTPPAQPAPVQEPVAWRHPENAACVTTDPTAYARGIPLYTDPKPEPMTEPRRLGLVRDLLKHIEQNTCTHDETHRGGAIWEICDSCGAKWADDEGGKPEFVWPDVVERAREYLAHGIKGQA
jgi:hypothetical protein